MNKVTKMAARPRSRVPGQLRQVVEGLSLDDEVRIEVEAVGRQVAGDALELTSADVAQLRDLARCCQRIITGERVCAELVHTDPTKWSAAAGKIQGDVGLKRRLLADLRVTKATREAGGAQRQKKPSGGHDWSGVL